MDIEVVLQTARDADSWECRIFTDADGQIELDLTARYFNSIITFAAPSEETDWRWLATWEQIGRDDEVKSEEPVELTVPQLIDAAPRYAEAMILAVTRNAAGFLAESEDGEETARGLALMAAVEQERPTARDGARRSIGATATSCSTRPPRTRRSSGGAVRTRDSRRCSRTPTSSTATVSPPRS
jgi:hypothetical protein